MPIHKLSRLLLVLTLVCAAAGSAGAATVAVQPAAQTVAVGQNFSIDIVASAMTDLYAFQFDLGFNPTVLSATLVTPGPFLANGGAVFFVPPVLNNVSGQISGTAETLLTAVSGVNGGGVLATIAFHANGPGFSFPSLFNVAFLDSSLSGISVDLIGGSVEVSGVPEPAALLLVAAGLIFVRRFGPTP